MGKTGSQKLWDRKQKKLAASALDPSPLPASEQEAPASAESSTVAVALARPPQPAQASTASLAERPVIIGLQKRRELWWKDILHSSDFGQEPSAPQHEVGHHYKTDSGFVFEAVLLNVELWHAERLKTLHLLEKWSVFSGFQSLPQNSLNVRVLDTIEAAVMVVECSGTPASVAAFFQKLASLAGHALTRDCHCLFRNTLQSADNFLTFQEGRSFDFQKVAKRERTALRLQQAADEDQTRQAKRQKANTAANAAANTA
jgi:hypothetical protein